MKKKILEEIKDTDTRLKKVFDDFMEQGKRTNQLLQNSFEQMKSSSSIILATHSASKAHNNSSLSHNISSSIPLSTTVQHNFNNFTTNEDHYNTTMNENILGNNYQTALENEEEYLNEEEEEQQQRQNYHQKRENKEEQDHPTEVSFTDTEALLKSHNGTLVNGKGEDFSAFSPSPNKNGNNVLEDDSLLSSLQSSMIFNNNQQFQQVENRLQLNNQREIKKQIGDDLNIKSNKQVRVSSNRIDFGKLFIGEQSQKSFEISNWSSQQVSLNIKIESDSTNMFSINPNTLTLNSFSSANIKININSNLNNIIDTNITSIIQIFVSNSPTPISLISLSAFLIIPQIGLLKSEQLFPQKQSIQGASNSGSQFVLSQNQICSIQVSPNQLGEVTLSLENKTIHKQLELELEVVYKFQDAKVTFFPQNTLIQPLESKKISLSLKTTPQSSSSSQEQQTKIFCLLLRLQQTPLVFIIRVLWD